MSLRDGLMAAFISATSLGVGASMGREGPVVHLGAAVGSFLSQRLHLGRALRRTLLGCGVAAAIAASFNAPIAGVFFALEVVVGHYALSAFAPIVISSVTGTVISRMYYGDYPAFVLPEVYEIASFWEFPAFAILGLISAVVAIVFMRSVMVAMDTFERSRLPIWSRPAIAGLAVGAVAVSGFPHILGVGYEATDAALSELYPLWLLIALAVLKTAATATCMGAGFGGGVFSPSLFLGAMTGGAYGIVATQLFPELSSGYGAYTIVGMGAVAGSVLGAPISTILMIFELTGSYALTIAVMVATVLASTISQQVHGPSLFYWQLQRRGVNIRSGQEVGLLRNIRVRRLLDREFETVKPDAPIAEVRDKLVHAPWGELFVVEDSGRLAGTISFHDLHEAAFDRSRDGSLTAADTMRRRPPVLHLDDDLERAVDIFGTSGEVHLPVVADREGMRLLGVAHEHELMATYHRALTQARREERGEI
jgi:CIC family chloride channel protein